LSTRWPTGQRSLAHFEQIKAIGLLEHELTIDGGELTPTLKVRRRVVAEKYKDMIDRIYAEKEGQYAASR
jgi:long-chain acyl-CoA synthetase